MFMHLILLDLLFKLTALFSYISNLGSSSASVKDTNVSK